MGYRKLFSSTVQYEEFFFGCGRNNDIQENKCLKYEWIDQDSENYDFGLVIIKKLSYVSIT